MLQIKNDEGQVIIKEKVIAEVFVKFFKGMLGEEGFKRKLADEKIFDIRYKLIIED